MMADREQKERMMRAGDVLRRYRLAQELTQADLQGATKRLEEQGVGKEVWAQQISRIEKGDVDRLPIEDVLSIAQVLKISTAQALQLYGLWHETPVRETDPLLRAAQDVLDTLDEDDRAQFESWVEFAIQQARALKARKGKVRGGNSAVRARVPTPVEAHVG